ncbi:restriction endonuclease subunit S, partial [Serratia sp. C2(2)]|uniref:restriction endonuclease subunit S n=1 Tax=Serratia sp. C2(2) TaxID=3117678 RepID=UPI002ED2E236|nr:restriction endonuclease subunit S [Serratia sp. C2(2)]
MNFSTERLEELCELIVDCPHSTPTWTDSGFVVLRNQNIRDGVLDLSSPSFTDEEGFKSRIKRATPKENDIVFTREAPMGEVCLRPKGLTCCLGQRQVLLRAKENINPHFLFWALQSPYVQHQIFWNEGTGTTVSNVRIPFIKDLKIPRLVGMEDTIAFTLNSLAQKLSNNNKINRTLEQIAQALFKSWF